MPRRTDLRSVLVIGSGPIVIGQAAEFDYSGTQACRVLREEGLRVVLVNSNPATIMTDPEIADATYIEPITPEVVATIIAKERPDALLPTLGGQVALNTAIALQEAEVLEDFGVELIGVSIDAIHAAENRQRFKDAVERCGAQVAGSAVATSLTQCHDVADRLGYPIVVRPSFTMGGLGSGVAHDAAQLARIAGAGLHYSPTGEVLLEESILGWQELELELVRDASDEIVVVCSIENVDPCGVHTGDSITVAPALTLSAAQQQFLQELAAGIVREVDVASGGCNVQFAIDPATGRVVVIEMNPRVSRSSALASKATGFPIAKVSARLAIGYTLREIPNDLAPGRTAAEAPELDYVAVKVPRFTFEKFPAAQPTLTTTMKSVGESMALGRSFTEALQKALRSIDKPSAAFHWRGPAPDEQQRAALLAGLATPTEERLVGVQQAMRGQASVIELQGATGISGWFLDQIRLINDVAAELDNAAALTPQVLARAKRHGFSDEQIGEIRGLQAATVREVRHAYDLRPVYKSVDTCAGQLPSATPYHYSTYEEVTEVAPRQREAVIILGSGPNRIGQGIEFDYSCVHASLALREHYETIMINCNPETVSTDYDISDRLYFEPLTLEDVLEVYDAERAAGPVAGVIVQLGGQTPLGLARELAARGVPILGTQPEAIDAAEDRGNFGGILAAAGLPAPAYGTAASAEQAREVAAAVGYPVLVRPSYVLGGAGMEIVYGTEQLQDYLARSDPDHASGPLLIDRFLDDAIEIDVDALYDGEELFLGGVMEHIEEAGIHSGDSACVMPPVTLSQREITRISASTRAIAAAVGVRGLINIQFALLSDVLYVIEANPRASRTVPLVAKASGVPLAKAASLLMVGGTIAELRQRAVLPEHDASVVSESGPMAVKEAVLPFKRFTTTEGSVVDTVLGPEMRSTGEVMGLDDTFPRAFAKSQAAAYGGLPRTGRVFISVADRDKRALAIPAARLITLGFEILATDGTAAVLRRSGIQATVVRKASDGRGPEGEPTVIDLIEAGQVDMVINTPSGQGTRVDGYEIRTAATATDKTIITTVQEMAAAVQAIEAEGSGEVIVTALQEHDRQRNQP